MGVVGYTYEQVASMPMEAVARSIVARKRFVGDIIAAVLGKPDEPEEVSPVSGRPLTPALFKAAIMGERS
jgi:hypothetical protein